MAVLKKWMTVALCMSNMSPCTEVTVNQTIGLHRAGRNGPLFMSGPKPLLENKVRHLSYKPKQVNMSMNLFLYTFKESCYPIEQSQGSVQLQ